MRKLLTVSWIPHWALLTGQAAHGLSWALLIALGLHGLVGFSLPGLAWVHLVALDYLSLISLAVLVHIFHGMLDLEWVAPRLARWSLLPIALGGFGLAAGFWLGRPEALAAASVLLGAGLLGYLVPAALTLARFRPDPEVSTAVWRAFITVLTLLAATATLGVAMAWALAVGGHPWLLSAAPAVHGHLGVLGWLGLLVMGVSTHTVKPITGGKSPHVWRHVVAAALVSVGLAALVVGLGAGLFAATATGAALAGAGTLVYAVDTLDVLRRARNPHRPPQAFLAAATGYFVVAAALGAGVLTGHTAWQAAYAYCALIGFLGQMVNGHLHHIGVRVLATVARGEDDETRPVELLSAPLSWGAFAASQAAVVAGTLGLALGIGPLVAAAGAAGLAGWGLMVANMGHAWRRAHRLP